jgi:hypothetical protein
MIKNLSQEYGDDLSKRFLDTVNSIFKQMFPEEPIPAEEAVPTQKMDELQNMFGEIEKNIDDSISYYMMMLGEFMELISSRCSEIQNSLQAYDQDLRKWIQDNIPIFKGSPLEEKMDQQMEKWVSAKEVVENKLSKMLER